MSGRHFWRMTIPDLRFRKRGQLAAIHGRRADRKRALWMQGMHWRAEFRRLEVNLLCGILEGILSCRKHSAITD